MTEKNKNTGASSPASPADSAAKKNQDVKLAKGEANPQAPSTEPSPKNKMEQAASAPQPPPQAASAAPQSSGGGKALSVIAILLVAALAGGGYYYDQQKTMASTQTINALKDQLSALQSDLQTQKRQTANLATQDHVADSAKSISDLVNVRAQQQDNTIASLQGALSDIKGRRPNDWLLAEADYLIKQAGRQLWLAHDPVTSARLIETADQRIAELNDPSLMPIRQALALDLQQVKAIKRLDTEGIVLRLVSLQKTVQELPLVSAVLPEAQAEEPKDLSHDVNDWKQNLETSFKRFISQFITYKTRDGEVLPQLTTAQTFYIQENMKAKLDQAITAVHKESQPLYDEALNTAEEWAKTYYNQDSDVTKGFLDTLNQLKAQKITVEFPQKLGSQKPIEDLLAERLSRELTNQVDAYAPNATQGNK